MPIFFGNAQVQGASNTFSIVNNTGTNVFQRNVAAYGANNFGYYANTGVPAFVAGSATDPGWVNPGASGTWTKINNYCAATSINRGNHYNTTTTRFTAPIAGPYLFIFSTYLYTDSYVHPIFAINGSATPYGTATGYGNTQYRIRGYGMVANYQQDAQIEEVINLAANDYVEAWWYNSGSCYHYAYYSLFQGVFVG